MCLWLCRDCDSKMSQTLENLKKKEKVSWNLWLCGATATATATMLRLRLWLYYDCDCDCDNAATATATVAMLRLRLKYVSNSG